MLIITSQIAAIGLKNNHEIVVSFRMNHIIGHGDYQGQQSIVSYTFGKNSPALNRLLATLKVTNSGDLLGQYVNIAIERNGQGFFKFIDIIENTAVKPFEVKYLQHLPQFTQSNCDVIYTYSLNRNPNVPARPSQKIFNHTKELI